jgi:hypothetical protein
MQSFAALHKFLLRISGESLSKHTLGALRTQFVRDFLWRFTAVVLNKFLAKKSVAERAEDPGRDVIYELRLFN